MEKGWGLKQKTNLISSIDVGCLEWNVRDMRKSLDVFRLGMHVWCSAIIWGPLNRVQKKRKVTELNLGGKCWKVLRAIFTVREV